MKKWFIFVAVACITAFTACHSGNGSHSGKDTVKNRYGEANDTNGSAKSTIDTGKMTSHDNSASGGTKAGKDTSTRKDSIKK